MSAVSFEEWAAPGLELELGGRTYMVPPPSVDASSKILASAVRGEIQLGIVKGEVPAEVSAVLDAIGPDEHPALGPVYAQLVADGVSATTIDRMGYYAVFYWARGREYADRLAVAMWAPETAGDDDAGTGGDGAPKVS
ncbi:DUF7426 family protein [Microbacterium halophytorum]|uniref:DUF7426 family protein n=1 Tax=Microbacterium halophytorum TaxID=2067568 RepID=UPI000CFB5B82|nr:hypothetical protein [Microbacterium halophytorum]